MFRKLSVVAAVTGVTIVLATGPALAHVEIEREGPRGVDGTVAATITVPNEESGAGTVKIELVFPDAPEISAAEAGAVQGWTATVEKSASGTVRRITWTGGPVTGTKEVQLPFELAPVPADVATMEFQALQTYDDEQVVRWIEETPPGGAEPEHPAPVLYVQGSPPPEEPATTPGAKPAESSSDRGIATGAIVAIVVGGLIVLGLAGLLLGRRKAQRSID